MKENASLHRRIDRTFAFIDLSGFTHFTDTEGDAAAMEILIGFRESVRRVASVRGVRIAKWLGDGAMLVGVEPEQTVEAVITMEILIDFSQSPLPMRAGIARGQVLLIDGDDHVGAPVIMASRLCNLAEPHQVLAPADLVMSLMVNTAARKIGLRKIDGFSEPIEVVQLSSLQSPKKTDEQ